MRFFSIFVALYVDFLLPVRLFSSFCALTSALFLTRARYFWVFGLGNCYKRCHRSLGSWAMYSHALCTVTHHTPCGTFGYRLEQPRRRGGIPWVYSGRCQGVLFDFRLAVR